MGPTCRSTSPPSTPTTSSTSCRPRRRPPSPRPARSPATLACTTLHRQRARPRTAAPPTALAAGRCHRARLVRHRPTASTPTAPARPAGIQSPAALANSTAHSARAVSQSHAPKKVLPSSTAIHRNTRSTMMKLRHSALSIAAGPVWLEAMQAHSPGAPGLILVAQTAVGNHRDSREAHFVQRLQKAGYATLLFDLLTATRKTATGHPLQRPAARPADRAPGVEWLRHQPPSPSLPDRPGGQRRRRRRRCARWQRAEMIGALVCRGGRPASPASAAAPGELPDPRDRRGPRRRPGRPAPGLRPAGVHQDWYRGRHRRLLREPGALDDAADGAIEWFRLHLRARPAAEDRHGGTML